MEIAPTPTRSTLRGTKFVVTVANTSKSFQPSTEPPIDSQDTLTPSATSDTSSNESPSSSDIFKKRYLLPGIVVATIVLVMLVAGMVLYIQRRKHRRRALMLARSLEPQSSIAASNLANVSDLERAASTSSKEGLLFRDRVHARNDADKDALGLFSGIEVDLATDKPLESAASADQVRRTPPEQTLMTDIHLQVIARAQQVGKEQENEVSSSEDSGSFDEQQQLAERTSRGSPIPSVHNWSVEDVQAWMNSVGFLEDVVETFRSHEIDGQRLLGLTDRILEHELGIEMPTLRSSILMIRARTFMEVESQQDDI
ncbi:hypothetical protein HDU97_001986 [Phlyctochytrium planicorne]|nr:hypothetical protein HDU97_001986 [Phlyctochytrium planicorne]